MLWLLTSDYWGLFCRVLMSSSFLQPPGWNDIELFFTSSFNSYLQIISVKLKFLKGKWIYISVWGEMLSVNWIYEGYSINKGNVFKKVK